MINSISLSIITSSNLYRTPYDLVVIVSIEGQLAAEEKEHYHPYTPQIGLFAVALHCEDLVGGIDRVQINTKSLQEGDNMVQYDEARQKAVQRNKIGLTVWNSCC
jgi:hypothetical protein